MFTVSFWESFWNTFLYVTEVQSITVSEGRSAQSTAQAVSSGLFHSLHYTSHMHITYSKPLTSQSCVSQCAYCKCVKRKTMSGVHLLRFRSMFLKRVLRTMGYSCYQKEEESMWPSPRKKKRKDAAKSKQNSWTLWPHWGWEIKCISVSQYSPLRHLEQGAETDFKVPSQLLGPDEVLSSVSQYVFSKAPKHLHF